MARAACFAVLFCGAAALPELKTPGSLLATDAAAEATLRPGSDAETHAPSELGEAGGVARDEYDANAATYNLPVGLVPAGAVCTTEEMPQTANGYVVYADPADYDPIATLLSGGSLQRNWTVATNLTVCKKGHHQNWVMGPFESTGGYDWWQISYKLSDRLGFDDENARYVGEWAVTMHDSSGSSLGLPPIHHHHLQIGMDCTNRNNDGTSLRDTFPFANTQGDQGCADKYDGTPCLVHNDQKKGVYRPLWKTGASAASILNDARPSNSPTLKWWYQFRFTTVDAEVVESRGLEPLSALELKSPAQAKGSLATNPVFDDVESFAFYTNTWKMSGTLITGDHPTVSKYHTHQQMHQITYLIAGTPAEIGLGPYHSVSKCDSILTNTTGFPNNSALIANLTAFCPSCFSLKAPNTKLLCRARSSVSEHNSSNFDRHSKLDCASERLRFEENTTYTSLVFWAPHSIKSTGGMVGDGGTKYPEHSIWFLRYIADRSALNASDAGPQIRYDQVQEEFVHVDGPGASSCRTGSQLQGVGTYSCTAPLYSDNRP